MTRGSAWWQGALQSEVMAALIHVFFKDNDWTRNSFLHFVLGHAYQFTRPVWTNGQSGRVCCCVNTGLSSGQQKAAMTVSDKSPAHDFDSLSKRGCKLLFSTEIYFHHPASQREPTSFTQLPHGAVWDTKLTCVFFVILNNSSVEYSVTCCTYQNLNCLPFPPNRCPTSTCTTVFWCWPMPSTGNLRTGSGTVWPALTALGSLPSHGMEDGPCWTPYKRCLSLKFFLLLFFSLTKLPWIYFLKGKKNERK